jgi:serine/threonine-protein kinase
MHTTEQLNTALAGRYEIERRIGAGGMATVYLARDLKHHRKVAVKVLSPELGAVLGPERFLGEIEVTANLHHPNLLPLFDSGEAGGLLFYVMPYIEGETLRTRIERERQLTVDDAIHIACAIASALDYAHRHGVVHRDLKPENILLHENQPVVMDFGIALAVSNAGGARITQTGLSLGTPQYMSPEQATGDRQIDGRSDIYSLGAVVYELLTGDPPHTGSTVQAVIARVITDRPRSIRLARETVPEHVDAAIMKALAKLPADRFATPAEFGEALMGQRPVAMPAGAQHPGSLIPQRPGTNVDARLTAPSRRLARAREIVAWTIASTAIGAVVVTATRPKPATPYGEFRFELPDSITIPSASGTKLAITRDGSRIVFVGEQTGFRMRQLYMRRADDQVAVPIRGTDTAFNPSFSPRGDWLLFGTGPAASTLRKVPSEGGTPQRVADSVTGRASWGDDNRIVFVRGGTRVFQANSDGSEPRLLLLPDSSRNIIRYGWPEVLPGSKYALITYWRGVNVLDSARVGVISLAEGALTELPLAGADAHYVAPGYILFGRAGKLVFAAPFSLSKRRVTGSPALLLEDLWQGLGGATEFAVADNGMMIHHGGGLTRSARVVRVDSTGVERPLFTRDESVSAPRVSPSGSQIAVSMLPSRYGQSDIWIFDMASSALTRLTTDSINTRPEWNADGKRVLYISRRGDSSMIRSMAADGSGLPTTLRVVMNKGETALMELSAGPSGGYSVYRVGTGTAGATELYVSPTSDATSSRIFFATAANEVAPRVSPSGRSVAYTSDQTGRMEVYLRPLPGPGGATPVSINGGVEPVWSRDGKTIFYRAADRTIMAATVDQSTQLVRERRTLFSDRYLTLVSHQNYDAFPNGDFVFMGGTPNDARVSVTTDWKRLLQRQRASDDRQ